MTDPTTPTGKRHYDRVQRVGYAWFKGEDIIAIEQEAAAAEREKRFAPHPDEQHMFRTACLLCGLNGDIVLSIVGSDERITIEAPSDD